MLGILYLVTFYSSPSIAMALQPVSFTALSTNSIAIRFVQQLLDYLIIALRKALLTNKNVRIATRPQPIEVKGCVSLFVCSGFFQLCFLGLFPYMAAGGL